MKAKTKRGLRGIVLWINRIAIVIMAVCFVLLYVSSVIEVKGDKNIYHYQRTPIERRNTAFEDSSLFTQIMKDQIADITRMCVIRNQMESNGVYNGKKIIDISSFYLLGYFEIDSARSIIQIGMGRINNDVVFDCFQNASLNVIFTGD